MPQFDVSTFASQIFWLVISFSILLGIVYFVVVPRITRNFDIRRDKLDNLLSSADFHQAETERLTKLYETKLHEEHLKIGETIHKLQMDLQHKRAETEGKLHKRLDQEILKVEQEIEIYKERFFEEFSKILAPDISESLERLSIEVIGSDVMNQIINDTTLKVKKHFDEVEHD